jgi:hypothetical protein
MMVTLQNFAMIKLCIMPLNILQSMALLTKDGHPFMIDDSENFKIKSFEVFGHKKADTWGFVSSDFLPLDHKGYDEVFLFV